MGASFRGGLPGSTRVLARRLRWRRLQLLCGHNSEFVLTKEERRGLHELVLYHANAPEPSEIKAGDKALLRANAVTADNAQREHQVALRPRINSLVYLMATLCDPNLGTVESLRDRVVPVLHAQLRLVWDECPPFSRR